MTEQTTEEIDLLFIQKALNLFLQENGFSACFELMKIDNKDCLVLPHFSNKDKDIIFQKEEQVLYFMGCYISVAHHQGEEKIIALSKLIFDILTDKTIIVQAVKKYKKDTYFTRKVVNRQIDINEIKIRAKEKKAISKYQIDCFVWSDQKNDLLNHYAAGLLFTKYEQIKWLGFKNHIQSILNNDEKLVKLIVTSKFSRFLYCLKILALIIAPLTILNLISLFYFWQIFIILEIIIGFIGFFISGVFWFFFRDSFCIVTNKQVIVCYAKLEIKHRYADIKNVYSKYYWFNKKRGTVKIKVHKPIKGTINSLYCLFNPDEVVELINKEKRKNN